MMMMMMMIIMRRLTAIVVMMTMMRRLEAIGKGIARRNRSRNPPQQSHDVALAACSRPDGQHEGTTATATAIPAIQPSRPEA